jgi:hypothetical protein
VELGRASFFEAQLGPPVQAVVPLLPPT